MSESNDTIPAMLNSSQQQRLHWSAMITTLMGFVIVLNGGLWTYFVIEYIKVVGAQPTLIIVPSVVSSITLGLWRIYTRYLDTEIVSLYPEIIFYEASLSVPRDFGLSGYLIRKVSPVSTIICSRYSPMNKARVIRNLVKAKRIGNRGHARIDQITLSFIGLTLIASIGSLWWVYSHSPLETQYCVIYIILVCFIIAGLSFVIIAMQCFQKNPSVKLIQEIIKHTI